MTRMGACLFVSQRGGMEVDDEDDSTYNAKDTKKIEQGIRGKYYVRYSWTW